MNYDTIIMLFVGHVLGDFVLQPQRVLRNKARIWVVAAHALLVTAITYAVVGSWCSWVIFAVVLASHFAIDLIKVRFVKRAKVDNLTVFTVDQTAHLLVIGLLAVWMPIHDSFWVAQLGHVYVRGLVLAGGIICALLVSGVITGKVVQPLLLQLNKEKGDRGFENGGLLIGRLERGLIFLFVVTGYPAAVGFLIAAKSVLRFGDAKDKSGRMEAEYVIVGTLSSFLFGSSFAFLTRWMLGNV